MKLRDEWYRKLKNDGFKDIEKASAGFPTTVLEQYHSCYFVSRYGQQEFEETIAYYDAASALSLKGESFLNAKIWRLHSQGVDQPTIGKQVKRSTARVNQVIQIFRKRFLK